MNIINMNFYNTNRYTAEKKEQLNFYGGKALFTKEYRLAPKTIENLAQVSGLYDKINSFFSKLNGINLKKFKALYPNIDSGTKARGFVLKDCLDIGDKKLQIVKRNSVKTNESDDAEWLVFNLLDKDDNKLAGYRISKNGAMEVKTENKDFLPKTEAKESDIARTDNPKTELLTKEFLLLNTFVSNAKEIYRKTIAVPTRENVLKCIQQYKAIEKCSGAKEEISSLLQTYTETSELLGIGKIHGATDLKKEFFGTKDEAVVKGYKFKDDKTNRTYSVCSLNRKDNEDAALKVTIEDKKKSGCYILYKTGKITKRKSGIKNDRDIRDHHFEQISKETAVKDGLVEAITVIKSKLEQFQEYVQSKRQPKIKPVKIKISVPKSQKVKVQKKRTVVPKQRVPKAEKIAKTEKVAKVEKTEKIKPLNKTEIKPADIPITSMIESIDEIFKTPVEKRSSHLIHEKMSDGRIFEGRFRVKSKDGTEIVVSKIKSPRYVDFIYYSINVNKADKKFIINLDPETKRIISSVDGKPVIKGGIVVEHISKKDFLESTPEAGNYLEYINEIFKYTDEGKRKVIKLQSKKSQNKQIIADREKEILKLLNQEEELI